MSGHTKEPWKVDYDQSPLSVAYVLDSDGKVVIARVADYKLLGVAEANARRILACVNACAGIPTEDLEAMASNPTAGMFGRLAAKACSERDQLLSAATAFSNYVHGEECATDGPVRFEYAAVMQHVYRIREAIATAEVKP